jgi:hypothetical protein
MDVINHLEQRVDETKRDLQDAHEKVQEWMSREDMLRAELQGYERALAAEMRREGRAVVAPPPAIPVSVSEKIEVQDSGAADVQSKAEFARKFIRDRVDTGATPAEIFKGFQEAGIPITKPYIYSVVQRLQKRKPPAIRLRRGKWYPVPDSEQPLNGTGEKDLP